MLVTQTTDCSLLDLINATRMDCVHFSLLLLRWINPLFATKPSLQLPDIRRFSTNTYSAFASWCYLFVPSSGTNNFSLIQEIIYPTNTCSTFLKRSQRTNTSHKAETGAFIPQVACESVNHANRLVPSILTGIHNAPITSVHGSVTFRFLYKY